MALYGPTNVLFDITCTNTPTRIASRNSAADVAVPTPLSGGFLQIPFDMGGFGFEGTLQAQAGNSGNILITCVAADTPTTDNANPTTSNSKVVNQSALALGSITLKPGESTPMLVGLDLYTMKVSNASGANNVLHVAGTH